MSTFLDGTPIGRVVPIVDYDPYRNPDLHWTLSGTGNPAFDGMPFYTRESAEEYRQSAVLLPGLR